MATKVFIDGEAGTTGLQIRDRLEGRRDLTLLSLSNGQRKDPHARRSMLNECDVAILCLPDDAARESVSLIESDTTRVIDASTAHRVADGWVYGFPEMEPGHEDVIAGASRVANTGCYAVASVALLRPMIGSGLLPADYPLSINAVSGYSGGGKALIRAFEDETADDHTDEAVRVYGLGLKHKHIPEITHYSGLTFPPVFVPSVARYHQGMIVQIPLQLRALAGTPSAADVQQVLAGHYAGRRFVTVAPLEDTAGMAMLRPDALNDSNELRLFVFHNADAGQVVLTGLLDNLGKGASGQAVQCLNIMTGADEGVGLDRPAEAA